MTKAFNVALSGLSFSDSVTFVKVFLGILIIYLLWGFLFARFDKQDAISQSRALGWTTIHFPLAFGLLLLLAALVVSLGLVKSVLICVEHHSHHGIRSWSRLDHHRVYRSHTARTKWNSIDE